METRNGQICEEPKQEIKKRAPRTMLRCAWCGTNRGVGWTGGFLFCEKCYPVMKISRISLGRYLIEQEKEKSKELTYTSTS